MDGRFFPAEGLNMGLSFPDAIVFLIVLFVFILYLGANGASSRSRILNGSIALFLALFVGFAALFLVHRFDPERIPFSWLDDMRRVGDVYRLLMTVGWLVLSVLLTRAFPRTLPFALRALAGLLLSFVLILLGGNFLFIVVSGA